MSVTYNLKNQQDYQDFFDSVIEDIEYTNPRDGQGYPLDDDDNRITVDWLWENYGHELDGTQTGLGYQVFSEVIAYYDKWIEPITKERKEEVIKMAKEDQMEAYECGQLNPEDDCDPKLLRESGLVTKEEQDVYTSTYDELVG